MLAREFFTAGRAIFTVSNDLTGERYTYSVEHKTADGKWPETWFASYLTGPDNEQSYTYIGVLAKETLQTRLTAKSTLKPDSKPFRVLNWALRYVVEKREMPHGYAIRHSGVCSRCQRTLTVPESLDSGVGPECAAKLGIPYAVKVRKSEKAAEVAA